MRWGYFWGYFGKIDDVEEFCHAAQVISQSNRSVGKGSGFRHLEGPLPRKRRLSLFEMPANTRAQPKHPGFAGLLPDSPKKPIHAVVNAGTGEARTFKAVAEALMQVHGPGKIEYIPFPGDLKNRYQHYTQADVASLRTAGYTAPFTSLEEGVKQTFAEEPAV